MCVSYFEKKKKLQGYLACIILMINCRYCRFHWNHTFIFNHMIYIVNVASQSQKPRHRLQNYWRKEIFVRLKAYTQSKSSSWWSWIRGKKIVSEIDPQVLLWYVTNSIFTLSVTTLRYSVSYLYFSDKHLLGQFLST